MATCRVIVSSALRKLGRLGAGREPRTNDAADTLAALQGLYSSWIAAGSLGRLYDVIPTGSSFVAAGNQRILRTNAASLSVTLPELVSDGWASDYGDERRRLTEATGTVITVTQVGAIVTVDIKAGQAIGTDVVTPRDGAPVVISDREGGQTLSWIYDGTVKRWQSIDGLTLDSPAPRSQADPEGLAALLAMEVADQFGTDVSAFTLRSAARFQTALVSRFGMRREAAAGVYC